MARLLVKGGLGTGADGIVRDLEVAEGEVFALTGPTAWTRPLLRAIAGLDGTPFEVHVGDREVGKRAPEERGLGFVFPAGALFPHLTVVDNLSFPLVGRGTPRYQVEERLAEVTRLARLERILSRRPAGLSPIERVRVAIGRSLMRQPQVLLLDEPVPSVGASLRGALREEIIRLLEGARVTALFSTPDAGDAFAMAHRVALFAEGGVRQVGAPIELYANPADRFVAALAGSPPMNVCTLPVTEGVLGFGGTSLKVSASQAIVLGLRPEDLRFGEEPAPALHLRGLLERVELDGAFARVAVQVSDVRVWVHCETRMVPARGGDVALSVDPRCVHLFSADALGTRIPWEPQPEIAAPLGVSPPVATELPSPPTLVESAPPVVAGIPAPPLEEQLAPIAEPAPPVAESAPPVLAGIPAPQLEEQPALIAEPAPTTPPPVRSAEPAPTTPPPARSAQPAPTTPPPPAGVAEPAPAIAETPAPNLDELPPPPRKAEIPPTPVSVAPLVDQESRRSRRPRFGKKRRSASR